MRRSTADKLQETVVGYSTCVTEDAKIQIGNRKASYALLPVWMLTNSYRGKKYLFAMNGQTGKIIGSLPVSWGRFCALTAALTPVLSALAYGVWMLMGR